MEDMFDLHLHACRQWKDASCSYLKYESDRENQKRREESDITHPPTHRPSAPTSDISPAFSQYLKCTQGPREQCQHVHSEAPPCWPQRSIRFSSGCNTPPCLNRGMYEEMFGSEVIPGFRFECRRFKEDLITHGFSCGATFLCLEVSFCISCFMLV